MTSAFFQYSTDSMKENRKSVWEVEKNPLFSPSYVSLTVRQRMGSFNDLRFTLRNVSSS